jgi:hypothetical protein
MKGLTSIERIIVESIEDEQLPLKEIVNKSGLQEGVSFNTLQVLLIRGIIKFEKGLYSLNQYIPHNINEEINGSVAKKSEFLEIVEALVGTKTDKILCFKKIALDQRDEKIFKAMLWNLESFLKDAHQKSRSHIPVKNRKIIFWALGDVQKVVSELIKVY